jgi:hypothetical protein
MGKILKKTVIVELTVDLKDEDYIKDINDYVYDVITNQLETDESDFVNDWELCVRDTV